MVPWGAVSELNVNSEGAFRQYIYEIKARHSVPLQLMNAQTICFVLKGEVTVIFSESFSLDVRERVHVTLWPNQKHGFYAKEHTKLLLIEFSTGT